VAAVAAPAYLALAGLHWVAVAGGPAAAPAPPDRLTAPDADLLPKSSGGWERTDFTTQARAVGSFYGENSHVWTYRRGGTAVVVSVDFPFPGWHDLTRCYTSQGWQLDAQSVDEAGGSVEVRMTKPVARTGYLLFAEVDPHGRPLRPRPGGVGLSRARHEDVLRRWQARLDGQDDPGTDPPGPVYQIQLISEGYSPLTAEEEATARELFRKVLAAVRDRWATSP
jgi:hypothetical protein